MENDSHRAKIGGLWEQMGELQFRFMVEHGLKPQHHFLDVGCGSLRGGVHFIKYLERGHYFGIDRDPEVLKAGEEIELKRYGLEDKAPRLAHIEDFDFLSLNQQFDFALAQSVFTHLDLNSIVRCLLSIQHVLRSGGKFYATFFESPGESFHLAPLDHAAVDQDHLYSYLDRDPYHYSFRVLEWVCQHTDLHAQYIGEWEHPRDQRMAVFTRK